MTNETQSTTIATDGEPKRWPKHAVWLGFVITMVGALSYFLYFFQFPSLRDFPVLNLPIVLLGVVVAGAGCWQVFRRGRGALGKGLAGLGFLLTFGLAALFNFYVFSLSYQLPEVTEATASDSPAPEFTLRDHNNRNVTLSDYRNQQVVLVFYRGFW